MSDSNKTVLLVDDDAVFVEAMEVILESHYRVVTASNGSEGLDVIKRDPPDLVILDVMMDHMTEGFDVARTLRSNPETEKIPIIMLTGVDQVYNMRLEVDESWVPCDRYLEKPVIPDHLLEHIRNLIG